MDDDTVRHTLSNFDKEQAKIDSVGGFKPGRLDLQEGYDSQFKARVQEVLPVFKPKEFKQERRDFSRKVLTYEGFKSNAPYFDQVQQKTVIPSVYKNKNFNQQRMKDRRSISQCVDDQRQLLRESLTKLGQSSSIGEEARALASESNAEAVRVQSRSTT